MVLAVILLTACAGTKPALKPTTSSVNPTTTTQGTDTVTLDIGGYGYAIGDIISVDKNAEPKIGDIVYYDSGKNNDSCTSFGPGGRLAKITGRAGDIVLFTQQSFEINNETYDLGRTRISERLMWGRVKYDKMPSGELTIPPGEYLADTWLGFECGGETDGEGNSVLYNRYTIEEDAVIGIVS